MRSVSFVSRLEFDFKGNIAKNAIALGDADNDKDFELVIGSLGGDLAIFKGQHRQPWVEAHDLGMIMVVVIGDVLNEGKNSITCISGEGVCNIFEISNENIMDIDKKNLTPIHVQRLPANTKVALLADIDNDGELELILGLTDHVLRTYRWVMINQNQNDSSGKLVGLHKLELADQIGSISLNPSADGIPNIIVAQSGGTYINFQCYEEDRECDVDSGMKLTTPTHHPLASSRMRNPNVSSEILGGVSGYHNGKKWDSLIAVATLDGTLMLVAGDETIWSFQVDHQLFSISKLDLIGDGTEEVIACAWDGQTYMVNQKKESVRFQFEEPVSAFISGKFSVVPGQISSVLVYATFSDRIYLYYDMKLPSFRIYRLLDEISNHSESTELLQKFSNMDNIQLKNLFKCCLYKFDSKVKDSRSDENP